MNQIVKPAAPPAGMTQVTKPSLLVQLGERYSVEPTKLLETMKATVFDKDASNEEMIAFLTVANRYELDPFRGEIYAFRKKGKKLDDGSFAKGGIQAIVGVDGWASIINRHDQFDGVEFDERWSEDGRELLAVRCTIWRKDRTRPTVVAEYLSECRQNTFPWQNYPSRMLRHKALIQCARIAFGLGGVMDEEEAHAMDAQPATVTVRPATSTSSPAARLHQLAASASPVSPRQAPASVVANIGDILDAAAPPDAVKRPVAPDVPAGEPLATADQVKAIVKVCEDNGISHDAVLETIRMDHNLPKSVTMLTHLPARVAASFLEAIGGRA